MKRIDNAIPLFVPSFSSKGSLLLPNNSGRYVSDNYELLQRLDIRLWESYLISAYDVYYGLLPQNMEEWPEAQYLFIDSGGYEINDSYDINDSKKFNYHVYPWDECKMSSVYSAVVESKKFDDSTIILSGYDCLSSVHDQLDSFSVLQERFPSAVVNHLIKITDSVPNIAHELKTSGKLPEIDILGFTEKELGNTIRDRLHNIIFLNTELRAAGWSGYIHIFGGLEPALLQLYYIAGADIFDGLSWQRYRYCGNSSLYDPTQYILSGTEEENKFWMMTKNLSMLREIKDNIAIMADRRLALSKELAAALLEEAGTVYDLTMRLGV